MGYSVIWVIPTHLKRKNSFHFEGLQLKKEAPDFVGGFDYR